MTHWTAYDLDTREDSARDLALTEAASRADARAAWDGWQPEQDTADLALDAIACTGCAACLSIQRERARRAEHERNAR